MSKTVKVMPSPSEMEILNVLWETGPATVPDIHAALRPDGEATYTTTLKQVQRLAGKELIRKCGKKGRADVFEVLCSQDQIRGNAMTTFLRDVFDGSASALILNALGSSRPSKPEIEKIRRLLDDLDREGNSDD